MALWVRYEAAGAIGFGILEGDKIVVHAGNIFDGAEPAGATRRLDDVRLITPCVPTKMIGLWNNFHALADKLGADRPEEPLYFFKSSNCYLAPGGRIERPQAYDGRVIYEGELGIVIGKRCKNVAEAEVDRVVFGYTCVNDVTAVDVLNKDPSFAQWARAKSFDTFGPFGPAIATGLDPDELVVRTVLNGEERQNYPVADMIIPPRRIVNLISRELTLEPGDVICCGTSVGAGTMKAPENHVEVSIDGIGTLANSFAN